MLILSIALGMVLAFGILVGSLLFDFLLLTPTYNLFREAIAAHSEHQVRKAALFLPYVTWSDTVAHVAPREAKRLVSGNTGIVAFKHALTLKRKQ